MMTWYDNSIYDTKRPIGSFWQDDAPPLADGVDLGPLSQDIECDVAIIGGGYTGLSAAYHLARDFHMDVCVLEAGPLGWGASGRNAGFCTLPPMGLSYARLISRYGIEEARRFIATQVEAVDLVAGLARDENIDIQRQGQGMIYVAHAPDRFAELKEKAEYMKQEFGLAVSLLTREEMASTHHDSTEQFGALVNHTGFGLQPLRFMRGLAAATARTGARLYGRSEVLRWERDGSQHRLITATGSLRARRVIVATNGFTRPLHDAKLANRLVPVLSNIIVTRPMNADELMAQNWQSDYPCSNTRKLLFYYRMLPGNRFLFGARGDLTGTPADGAKMRSVMEQRRGEVFPHWKDVTTTHFWRGLICMNARLTPAIGQMPDDETVYFAMGYQGNGVAAAPWAGRTLARLMGGKMSFGDLPAPFKGMPPRIPLPSLRPWYLRAALGFYHLQDR